VEHDQCQQHGGCGGSRTISAWGIIRSQFAQIGGAAVVGVAGRTHEHT